MTTAEQIESVFTVLKKILKARQISYRELAERTGMSEANVKRIFSVQSCDLERIIQFCEAAEINFFELSAEAAKEVRKNFTLTEEAEKYFLEHFDCFIFFRQICAAENLEWELAHSALPKEKFRQFLRDLEDLGLLIKLKGSHRLAHTGYLTLSENSPLRKKLELKWVPWFMKKILEPNRQERHHLKMFSTGLTDGHYAQLLEDLNILFDKYHDLGLRDQTMAKGRIHPVALCIGIGPYRVGQFEDKEVPLLPKKIL